MWLVEQSFIFLFNCNSKLQLQHADSTLTSTCWFNFNFSLWIQFQLVNLPISPRDILRFVAYQHVPCTFDHAGVWRWNLEHFRTVVSFWVTAYLKLELVCPQNKRACGSKRFNSVWELWVRIPAGSPPPTSPPPKKVPFSHRRKGQNFDETRRAVGRGMLNPLRDKNVSMKACLYREGGGDTCDLGLSGELESETEGYIYLFIFKSVKMLGGGDMVSAYSHNLLSSGFRVLIEIYTPMILGGHWFHEESRTQILFMEPPSFCHRWLHLIGSRFYDETVWW